MHLRNISFVFFLVATILSKYSRADFIAAIEEAKEHILAGDIFQIVLSQRFERRTFADPYEIYRALRIVNPSPYMIYLQARGAILVASSPEILCRINDVSRDVTDSCSRFWRGSWCADAGAQVLRSAVLEVS